MDESLLIEMVRQFPENGMKVLLRNPQNVRDLLNLASCNVVDLIDFDRLKPLSTTFIKRDYRHVECDVVLSAPLRRTSGGRIRSLLVYILIEHQSNPDWLMPLRLTDYIIQLYWSQIRGRRQNKQSRAKLHPVLPIVFYTGTQHWESPGSLSGLIELGDRFVEVTPSFKPLFVNLGELPNQKLESEGGYFGWALRLVRERYARTQEFEQLLEEVVLHFETMPERERLRWLELLSYVHAFVYHVREGSEQSKLHDVIERSVQTDKHRQEVSRMGQTIAQELMEKGRLEGRQEGIVLSRRDTLVRLLESRFEQVPPKTRKAIADTVELAKLDDWFDRALTAESIEEIGIGKRK